MGTTIATNKKAGRDYALADRIESGIVLTGAELKSIRSGNVSFKDTFAKIENNQITLYNLYIAEYLEASYLNEDTDRPRKLLLHKKEIKKLDAKIAHQNLTLVPTRIYFNNRGYVKVELALGKGRKLYDKREAIKKRNVKRDIDRVIKSRS